MSLLLAVALGPAQAAAETWFDALIARVGNEPILLSDVILHEALFRSGKLYSDMTREEREAALVHLIQRRLLLTEAARFGVARPDDAQVEQAAAVLKKRVQAYQINIGDAALNEKVREQLWVEAFIGQRITAFVMIRSAEVEAALEAEGGPKKGESGADARTRVRQQLSDREASERLARFLARLYARAEVKRYPLKTQP
ncbi:MAG: hypothetical protein ACE5FN_12250 [Leptospirillia bacterium]